MDFFLSFLSFLILMILLNIALFKLFGKFKRIHPLFNFYITGLLTAVIFFLLLWVLPYIGIFNDLFKNMNHGYGEAIWFFLYFFGMISQVFYVIAIHFILLVCIFVKLLEKLFFSSKKS